MTTIPFACRCGAVAGTVSVTPRSGFHFSCHCGDCRGAAILAGAGDPGTEGTAIWHTTPDCVTLDRGRERLVPLRMRRGSGVLRWQAECCGDIPFATTRSPGIPFLGIADRAMTDTAPLGPLRARSFLPPKAPGGRQRNEGMPPFLAGLLRRTLAARMSGRWRANPLATATGYAKPRDLSDDERARAYP